ncbi:MAG: 50S ribosomal protein L25 [Thermomicrobiales bacterium]
MAKVSFPAQVRTVTGKQVRQLRRDGMVPGIVYGPVVEGTVPVMVDRREFLKFYQSHGHSTLFDLKWDGGVESVFIREVQVDPVRRDPLHIDFFAPNLRRPIRAMVPLVLHNAASSSQAVFTEVRTEVEVEALPARIPAQLDVDVSGLENVGDALHVRDITVPAGVELVTDGDELVAQMAPAALAETEEESAPADEEATESAESSEESGE